ncbi:hypothetical protein FRC04_011712 [Tulasnella sp. 424]|nr:hypothetical protein FRC04_011712 [Tulasnella sp. 424]KAG8978058.1 hypothetical protein FRC05_011173 [Tulasnella sp. 425]
MSTTTSNSKAFVPTPAAPPSAAEVQRKLSMHAQSPPSHRRKGSLSKSPVLGPAVPGLDLGNDISVLNPSASYGGITPQDPSSSQHSPVAQGPLATQMAQLSVIAERPGGSGEETDDDDDDDWNPMEGRSLEELNTLNDECTAKEGYLYKKGERRKTWKKRWFVLRQTQLSYYKTNKEYKLLRLLPMSEVHSVTLVSLKRHDHSFGIVTPARTYYVQAESAAEAESWVRALNDAKARSGGAAQEGRRNVPPTINIQRSTPMNILGAEPRTPPPQGYSGSPSSPSHHQQMTSSDSEDPDSYAPASPTVGPSGHSFASQMATTPGAAAAAGPLSGNKVIVQGYLMKCGSKRKTWRKRWFVLTPEKLMYAKNHMDLNTGKQNKAKAVPLNAILDAIECKVGKHPGHGLGLGGGEKGASAAISGSASMPGGSSSVPPTTPSAGAMTYSATQQQPSTQAPAGSAFGPSEFQQLPHTFKIVTPKRPLLLCAPSEEEEIRWLSAVRALIARRTTSVDSTAPVGFNQQPAPPQPPYQASGAQQGSPSKRSSRREMGGSVSSNSPPQGEFVIPPSQPSGIRKDATSLTGAAATAMAA